MDGLFHRKSHEKGMISGTPMTSETSISLPFLSLPVCPKVPASTIGHPCGSHAEDLVDPPGNDGMLPQLRKPKQKQLFIKLRVRFLMIFMIFMNYL